MTTIKTVFFGSTSDSVLVLTKLYETRNSKLETRIAAVVTQPPRPVGRKHVLTPTPVETWAKEHAITTLSFPSHPDHHNLYNDEKQVINTLSTLKADLLISACYGQKIPWGYIQSVQFGGLNVHPSLLPRWRGADPVPWAILTGDHQIGVSVVTLSKEFDEGAIIAQKKIPITDIDTSDALRTKLFSLGAQLLTDATEEYIKNSKKYESRPSQQHNQGQASIVASSPYARRLTRDDGFIPWELLKSAIDGIDIPNDKRPPLFSLVIGPPAGGWSLIIARAWRALHPWPGIWTLIETRESRLENRQMRLKIISCHLEPTPETRLPKLVIDSVQLEGKTPVPFSQFSSVYLPVFSR